MFNNKRIKELERKIEDLKSSNTERLREFKSLDNKINKLEKDNWFLKYPNGYINTCRETYCNGKTFDVVWFMTPSSYPRQETIVEIKASKDDVKQEFKSEKLSDDKYLVYSVDDKYRFLVNTSTNQSIRVDKDMKIVL